MSTTVVKEECPDGSTTRIPSGVTQNGLTNKNFVPNIPTSTNSSPEGNNNYNLSVLLTNRVQNRCRGSPVATTTATQNLTTSPATQSSINTIKQHIQQQQQQQPKNCVINHSNHHPPVSNGNVNNLPNGIEYSNNNINSTNTSSNSRERPPVHSSSVVSSSVMPSTVMPTAVLPHGDGKRAHSNNKTPTNVSISRFFPS